MYLYADVNKYDVKGWLKLGVYIEFNKWQGVGERHFLKKKNDFLVVRERKSLWRTNDT